MGRRLKTICKYINEHVAGLTARTEKGYCDTRCGVRCGEERLEMFV